MVVHIFFLVALVLCVASTALIEVSPEDQCVRKCGNNFVPYPFGLDKPFCSKDPTFNLTCNRSVSPPTLLLGSIPILKISLEDATAIIELDIAYTCYNQSGVAHKFSQDATMDDRPFLFSTSNKFTAIGCDTIGYLGADFLSPGGCVSICNSHLVSQYNFTDELKSCGDMGCCQTEVPKGLKTLGITLKSYNMHHGQLDTNPCSFGFLSDPSWYEDTANFTLSDMPDKHVSTPVVLDWAIRGNITCKDKDDPGYICGLNTNCIDSENGPGYVCACKQGSTGNPYTKAGCQAISDCEDPRPNPCNGRFVCACSFRKHGNGKAGWRLSTVSKIAIGLGASVLFVTFLLLVFWSHKKQFQQSNRSKDIGGPVFKKLSVQKEPHGETEINTVDSKNYLGEVEK